MFGLLSDVLRVAAAPIKVAVAVVETAGDVARVVTKPVADVVSEAANAVADDIRSIK